ncbi:sensor histidine kinase [Gaetbulibacter aestuarii]|uniref:histidine kinase n=1 Tax=Gaetbulibacter aestuarii TaxID=1502358 RepID=A0ABW7MXA5_9FLAO
MNLSFRNRIALYYMIATAIIVAIIFGVVYFVVKNSMYDNLDKDLSFEASKHAGELQLQGDKITFFNKAEWEENEHREIQINPVFIQIADANGKTMDKSPNLKNDELPFKDAQSYGLHFNTFLKDKAIRQIQKPIQSNGETKGYLIAAISLEPSIMVLLNLRNILIISYLLLLSVLYFISRYLAGRSIIPVKNITNTTNRITKNNLNERVALPEYQDELYDLSTGINKLLQRIENAIERERQFTSDASHELRTPLATLRGNLEVLIRKPRTQQEYEEKIDYCLSEIDTMSDTIEQLLLLARLDSSQEQINEEQISLNILINDILKQHQNDITIKNLRVIFENKIRENIELPKYYATLILDNIISNAIKYSKNKQTIQIILYASKRQVMCKIQDEGIGIKSEDIPNIFNHFFRSDALNHKSITGNGLGLSIAQKSAESINAEIEVKSELGKGSIFIVYFNK